MASLLVYFWIQSLIILTFNGVEFSLGEIAGEKWSGTTPSGLYVASDKVALLSADNFNTNVQNSSYAWLVQFYNSWCGHCIKFSPVWKQLAADIYNWRRIVKVSAIDCSDDQNTQHCRDYEIMGYPTIRYFAPHLNRFTIGDEFPRQKDDADYLRNEIVAKLEKNEQTAAAPIPNWPNLAPVPDTDDILAVPRIIASLGADILLLIFENGTSFVGRDLIMDLYSVAGLDVRRFVRRFSDGQLPEIRVYTKNGELNGSIVPLASHDRRTVYASVSEYLRRNYQLDVPDPFANRTGDGGQRRPAVKVKQSVKQKLLVNTVFETDLETALWYTLYHEILLKSHIEDDRMRALVAYLRVLSKYFPPTGAETRIFLSNLAQSVAAYEKLTDAKFREILTQHDKDDFYLNRKQWTGCKGSTATYRGYPCGLWTMFHTLSARKYSAEVADPRLAGDPAEVLNAMVGYIRYFFGCQDCAEHFVQMSGTITAENVTSAASAVLWLWQAHNNVNRRLAGDGSEDPSYPKVQFPLDDMCPQCRYNNGTAWNESNVLSYLITMYTNVHRVQDEATVYRLRSDYDDDAAAKSSRNFAFIDANLACFALYVLCACLLTAFAAKIFLKRSSIGRRRVKYETSYEA